MTQKDTCRLGAGEQLCTRPSATELFLTFFKIGSIGFGGGPALISIIRQEIVEKKKWIADETYLQGLAISLVPPGSMMVNVAFFVGGLLRGFSGGLLAILGILLPSFVLMIILAALLVSLPSFHLEAGATRGLVPAVTGVLLAMVVRMGQEHLKNYRAYMFMLGSGLVMYFFGVPPFVILLLGFLGGIIGWFYAGKSNAGKPAPSESEIDGDRIENNCSPVNPSSAPGKDLAPPLGEGQCQEESPK